MTSSIQTYSFSNTLTWNAFERDLLPREKYVEGSPVFHSTRKLAPRTGAKSPCVPQRWQRRLGQACLTKTKWKAVQPELEEVPKRWPIKSAAANGTAPLHISQPSKGCSHSATYCVASVPSTRLCFLPASSQPQRTIYHCADHSKAITWISAVLYRLFESMKEGFHQLS